MFSVSRQAEETEFPRLWQPTTSSSVGPTLKVCLMPLCPGRSSERSSAPNTIRKTPISAGLLPETIVRRGCAALIPYARNARTHSDQQVKPIGGESSVCFLRRKQQPRGD
jgi:hypothetical protein